MESADCEAGKVAGAAAHVCAIRSLISQNGERMTIREFAGELWAELAKRVDEKEATFEVRNQIVDIVMGVLARHSGSIIENDRDLPVDRLE